MAVKLLVAIIFIMHSTWAESPRNSYLNAAEIIYNPKGSKPGRFVLAYKDFEDIRLDSDLDGLIDFWYLKKGTTEVHTFFRDGKAIRWQVRKGRDKIQEVSYRAVGDTWRLEDFQVRPSLQMNREDNSCELSSTRKKIKAFSEDIGLKATLQGTKDHLIETSCAKNLSNKDVDKLATAISKALVPEAKLFDCLLSDEFEKSFKKDSFDISIDLLKSKYELQMLQLSQQPDRYGPLVKCEKLANQKKALTTDESTQTIHLDPKFSEVVEKSGKGAGSLISEDSISHELLHRAGLKNESDVHKVEKFCKDHPDSYPDVAQSGFSNFSLIVDKNLTAGLEEASKNSAADTSKATSPVSSPKKPIANSENTNKGFQTTPVKEQVTSGSQLAAAAKTADIPVELTMAQTRVPEAQTLSASISNPSPATEAGAQQALVRSASESSGVLRMANNLAGAISTPAVASDRGLAGNDSEADEVSGSRLAKTAKSNTKISPSRNIASETLRAASRNGLAADERVVEQITLDGAPAVAASVASASNERTPVKNGSTSRSVTTGPSGGSSEVASSSPAAPTGGGIGFAGGSSAGASLGSSASSGGGSPSRRPAAESSAERALANAAGKSAPSSPGANSKASSGAARDEVITFISQSNYSQAKKKLKDPSFSKQLESQKITVLDLYGNTYGAAKGEVIFLDQGDRFVRQK